MRSLRYEVYVGTAAFGCPRSKAPLVYFAVVAGLSGTKFL